MLRWLRCRGDHGAHPAARRPARPDLRGRPAARWPGTCARGATVIVESTSYPGTTQEQVLPWLEDGSGLVAGTDFHLGYSPERIDPGNRTWTLATTPKIVSGIDAGLAARWQNFYARHRGPDRGGLLAARGRAGQAHREHLPAREHRADERAGDVRPRARRQRVGGDRRRVHQAVRVTCRSRPARAWAATACPSTRRTCPGGWSGRSARASGSSSWPTTSTATCRTTWSAGSCWR